MYLKGSKWNLNRKRKRTNPWLIFILVILIAVFLYIEQAVVPAIDHPLFISTSTATRDPHAYTAEAEALAKEGKINLAIDAYKTAILADPQNATNYVALARLQVLSGNLDDALINSENALLLNKNNSLAYAVRGWILGLQSEYQLGEASLNTALEIDPNNALANAYLAEILTLRVSEGKGLVGTIDEAAEASRRAQLLDPNSMETHRARGIVLEQTGNFNEAIAEYQAAIQINDKFADLHLALGRTLLAIEEYSSAIDEFIQANALNPSDPLPETYIARAYVKIGEYAKAIQYAQQAVNDNPTDPFMHGNLGSMLYRNQQYADAVISLRMAIRGGSTEDGTLIKGLPLDYTMRIMEYYYTYGLALARLNQCGEAVQIAQTILQTVMDDETSVYNAQEMIRICQANLEILPTSIVEIEVTPTP
ncbi:MAG: tetratricopeptide repeat protein [Anaerolineaceae bacterium]|nr:tetratricopeptide repeat protein [Anaerolineaceae bacterium]